MLICVSCPRYLFRFSTSFGIGSEFATSRTWVGQGNPRMGCNFTRCEWRALGLGRGVGMKQLSGCCFFPGKFVSIEELFNRILKQEFLTLSTLSFEIGLVIE